MVSGPMILRNMKQSLQIPNELRSPTSIKKTRVFAKGLGPFHWHLTVTLDSPINLAEFFLGEKIVGSRPIVKYKHSN